MPTSNVLRFYFFHIIISIYYCLFVFIIAILVGMTEKAMAPHSSTLAWKIPWMEEPGRLQSMGSLRVRYN